MDIEAVTRGDIVVMRVNEDRIDSASAIRFRDRVSALTPPQAKRLILDLERVGFIDSSGLGAIVGVMKTNAAQRRLELARPTQAVLGVMRLTKLDTVIPIHDRLPV